MAPKTLELAIAKSDGVTSTLRTSLAGLTERRSSVCASGSSVATISVRSSIRIGISRSLSFFKICLYDFINFCFQVIDFLLREIMFQ